VPERRDNFPYEPPALVVIGTVAEVTGTPAPRCIDPVAQVSYVVSC
jgi:hypothetical protein